MQCTRTLVRTAARPTELTVRCTVCTPEDVDVMCDPTVVGSGSAAGVPALASAL